MTDELTCCICDLQDSCGCFCIGALPTATRGSSEDERLQCLASLLNLSLAGDIIARVEDPKPASILHLEKTLSAKDELQQEHPNAPQVIAHVAPCASLMKQADDGSMKEAEKERIGAGHAE